MVAEAVGGATSRRGERFRRESSGFDSVTGNHRRPSGAGVAEHDGTGSAGWDRTRRSFSMPRWISCWRNTSRFRCRGHLATGGCRRPRTGPTATITAQLQHPAGQPGAMRVRVWPGGAVTVQPVKLRLVEARPGTLFVPAGQIGLDAIRDSLPGATGESPTAPRPAIGRVLLRCSGRVPLADRSLLEMNVVGPGEWIPRRRPAAPDPGQGRVQPRGHPGSDAARARPRIQGERFWPLLPGLAP